MGLLDRFCRFCAEGLDIFKRRNIFASENSHLLETAQKCIALPMSAEDCYPNYVCYPCARKLNDIAEFQMNISTVLNIFDKFLLRKQSSTTPAENFLWGVNAFDENNHETGSKNKAVDVQNLTRQLRPCRVVVTRCDEPIKPLPVTQVETGSSLTDIGLCDKKTPEKPSFTRNPNLATHRRISHHTGEKCYQCEHCQKQFSKMSSLGQHVRKHTNEKYCQNPTIHNRRYKCAECLTEFNTKSLLTQHIRIHVGERPNKCETCQKGFKFLSGLKRHKISHSGEKPFQCSQCLKFYGRKDLLNQHKRLVHTGNKPFACHINSQLFRCEHCGKGFYTDEDLVLHRRIHTDQKPFQCKYCDKCYLWRRGLARHLLLKHLGRI